MALGKIKVRQTTGVNRVAEGDETFLKGLRDGTLSVTGWINAMSLEGRIFTANIGIGGSDATFGDGGLDTDEYDMFVSVPSGTCIIPLHLTIDVSVVGTALLMENVMQSGTGGIVGASGVAVTPICSNLNTGNVSACTVTGESNDGGTALQANIKEIWRDGLQRTITHATVGQIRNIETFRWNAMDSGILDVVGPSAQLVAWNASNATQGFITLKWIELPASALT